MKLNLKITQKLTLFFVLFAALLLMGVGSLAYYSGRTALQAAITSNLSSIAIEKQAAIDVWVKEVRSDIASIAASDHLREEVASLMVSPNSTQTRAFHSHLLADLNNWSGVDQHFQTFLLIEPKSGKVIAATDPNKEGTFVEEQLYFINGKEAPYVQNAYYDLTTQTPFMTASSPIVSANGQLIAVLAGHLNISELNEIIARRTDLNKTDDSYLVNKSHLFVTQPRFATDAAILKRGIYSEAVNKGLAGNNGIISAKDYRGVPAIAAYRWLPERQLCLIVKIDQEEAIAPSQVFGKTIIIIGAIVLLLASIIAVALARTINRPILVLKDGAERFGKGDLNFRLPETSEDEIGLLTKGFNTMAVNLAEKELKLQTYATELEQMVEIRTAKLKQSEESLRESELKFRNLIENAPDAVYVHADGRFVFLNPAAVNLFDAKTADQLIGSPVVDRIASGYHEMIQERIRLLYEDRKKLPVYEQIYLRLDGSSFPVEVQGVPIDYDNKNAALTFVRDITERKRAEEALNKTMADLERSNRDLEQFAYVASHDLQEPLRMVSSYTQLLSQQYEGQLDEKAKKFIDYAVDGAIRMQGLINDLLTYSRVGTRGKPSEATDSHALLGEVIRNLAALIEEKRAVITNDDLPTVWADASQLMQVFQNLISNAIKFQGDNIPHIHVSAQDKGREWVFSIRDNGIGIEKKHADRIFVIFQRLHTRQEYSGTGIGLAVCKRIVERHGGKIWFESELGIGTTFFFSIPK